LSHNPALPDVAEFSTVHGSSQFGNPASLAIARNFLTNYLPVSARSTSQPRFSRVTIVFGLIFSRRAQSPMLVEIPFQVIILARMIDTSLVSGSPIAISLAPGLLRVTCDEHQSIGTISHVRQEPLKSVPLACTTTVLHLQIAPSTFGTLCFAFVCGHNHPAND
jgi:hypothetical protein